MGFEHTPTSIPPSKAESDRLATEFRELISGNSEIRVFEHLEDDLSNEGFMLAEGSDLAPIFYDNTLFCRSEAFGRVMDLILEDQSLNIMQKDGAANVCSMASGEGFKVAMTEGFSGKDVHGAVKVVVTFEGNNLTEQNSIARESELWIHKPKTAAVSRAATGVITRDNIRMVSFRFPIHLFPEALLTELEKEQLDENGIKFVVRHYIPTIKKTVH